MTDETLAKITFCIILGFISLVIYVVYANEQKKRKAFRALAQRLKLSYSPGSDRHFSYRFGDVLTLRFGHSRYSKHILSGVFMGHEIMAFEHHYTTKSGEQSTHHTENYYFCQFIREFPFLELRPENFFDKIGAAIGFNDIDFESLEFSKAFSVRSKDKKFAYDICNTEMMAYLLQNPKTSFVINNCYMGFRYNGELNVNNVELELIFLVELRKLIPEYLFKN